MADPLTLLSPGTGSFDPEANRAAMNNHFAGTTQRGPLPQTPGRNVKFVEDNRGVLFLADFNFRTRYPVTGPGQIAALSQIYGPPIKKDPDNGGPIYLHGWTQGPSTDVYFNRQLGVSRYGLEMVARGERPNPLDPGAFVEPSNPELPTTEPRDWMEETRLLYPWLADAPELLDIYVNALEDSENPQLALQVMRDSPQYQQYFPGNKIGNGRFRMSEQEYFTYREMAIREMRQAGLPTGFYDEPEDIGKMVAGDISLNELTERIRKGFTAALQAPAEVRQQLQEIYGVGMGGLAAVYLDPARGMQALERMYTEAQIGGAAVMSGYGNLTGTERSRLADLGVDAESARQGFQQLSGASELFGAMSGTSETSIGREDQLGGVFAGDARALRKMNNRRESRTGAFRTQGGAMQTERGVIGLGENLA